MENVCYCAGHLTTKSQIIGNICGKCKYSPIALSNIFDVTHFRYAKHYFDDNVQKRTLLKVFGIRFDIIVQSLVSAAFEKKKNSVPISNCGIALEGFALCRSQARKFDIIPTLTAIGSGVGIFGVVSCCPDPQ